MAFASDKVFAQIGAAVKADPSQAKKVNGVYRWNVKKGNDSKIWTMDLKSSSPVVKVGAPSKADCTISVADEDFVKMATGSLNAQQAFMQGKLKISGNMSFAMKLSSVMNAAKAKL